MHSCMRKGTVRGIAGFTVLLILYILVVFLTPFARTAVFWVSFLFTLIAFGVVAMSLYMAFVKKPDAKSKFYGFPIAKIGVIYGIAQLLVGLLFMALGKWVPVWLAVLLYAVLLGAAVIGLISADAVVEEIHSQDAKLRKNVTLMRTLQSKLNQIASQCDNTDAASAVKEFAEELRYSDPVSGDALADIERDLTAAVDELQSAVIDGDSASIKQLCRKASGILVERNRLCKLNKS